MLARLRREFVAIMMLVAGLVLAGVLGTALFTTHMTHQALTRSVLQQALEGGVSTPLIGDSSSEQSADVMLAAVVDVSKDGTVSGFASDQVEISPNTLMDVIPEALKSESDSGESDSYPISWMRAQTGYGWRIALVDTYTRDLSFRSQALSSLIIFAVSMTALFFVSYLLSGWALSPVKRAWDDQRRFVSDASHELKTPLAVILANAQILEEDSGLPDESRRWVRSTSEEAKHMRQLVEDLLTLARADEQAEEGRSARPTAPTSADLTALVSGCALEFDAVAFERGCSIECDLEQGVSAPVDSSSMGRVVRTLLDNATKYAEKGSVVRVTLAREGHRARIAVNNRGEVISPEDLPHLFDRFYRTDRARERSAEGGFGLGLAIAKSLVETAGGKISATSSEQDGTTFTVVV